MSEQPCRLQEQGRNSTASTAERSQPLRKGLLPFGRRHRVALGRGLLFTCLLVGSRLALPIPLVAIVEQSSAPVVDARPAPVQGWGDPVALLVVAFVALALLAGMAEHFQRMAHARFVGRSVNDARSAAVARIGRLPDVSGELAARVMGDSARVKQGLKGVLNHITLNGLLVLGACVALAVTDPLLGLIQFAGATIVVAVAIASAKRAAAVAAEHREGEALLTGVVHRIVAGEQGPIALADLERLRSLDGLSGQADTNMTRWEGRAMCVVYVILALTAAAVLALGVGAAETGRLGTGELVSVVAYLLLIHGPAVRFARQITRIGPLFVSAHHVGIVLQEDPHLPRPSLDSGAS